MATDPRALLDRIQQAIRQYQVQDGVSPGGSPHGFPEPGTPSGVPAIADDSVRPNIGTGTMLRPASIRELKFEARWRRKLKLASGFGFDGYPAQLFAALGVDQFNTEDWWPEDQLAIGWNTATPGAAQVGQIALFNPAQTAGQAPAPSLVLEAFIVGMSVAGRVALRIATGDPGGSETNFVNRDLRQAQNINILGGGLETIWTAVSAGGATNAGSAFAVFPVIANQAFYFPAGWVFPPGVGLSVGGPVGQGALTIDATFIYRRTRTATP